MNLRHLHPPPYDPILAGDTTARLVSSETPYSRRGDTRGPINSAASPSISQKPRQQAQMDVPRVLYIPLRFEALAGTRPLWCLWRGTADAVIFKPIRPPRTRRLGDLAPAHEHHQPISLHHPCTQLMDVNIPGLRRFRRSYLRNKVTGKLIASHQVSDP